MQTTHQARPKKKASRSKKRNHMRLPKVEVQRRNNVALEFFKKNPLATGDAFNKALTDGTLTGKTEPAMNIKRVYDVRKEARKAVAAAEVPPTIPEGEFKNARRFRSGSEEVAVVGPSLTEPAKGFIRGLLAEMTRMPADVQDLTLRRDGTVVLGRMARTEQPLVLGSSAAVVTAVSA